MNAAEIGVTAKDGVVSLTGVVDSYAKKMEPENAAKKEAAKSAINYLMGVKGLTNNIKIKSETHDAIEKKDVEYAIARSWSVDDSDINVSVSGTTVT